MASVRGLAGTGPETVWLRLKSLLNLKKKIRPLNQKNTNTPTRSTISAKPLLRRGTDGMSPAQRRRGKSTAKPHRRRSSRLGRCGALLSALACVGLVGCGDEPPQQQQAALIILQGAEAGKWLATMTVGGSVDPDAGFALRDTMVEVFVTSRGGLYSHQIDIDDYDEGNGTPTTAKVQELFQQLASQVQAYAVETLSAAYTDFPTVIRNPYGTELPSAVPYLHGGISRNLAALPGGLDELYTVAKKRTPKQSLPHKDIFMAADATRFGPIVKKAIEPIVPLALKEEALKRERARQAAGITEPPISATGKMPDSDAVGPDDEATPGADARPVETTAITEPDAAGASAGAREGVSRRSFFANAVTWLTILSIALSSTSCNRTTDYRDSCGNRVVEIVGR